MQVILQKRQPFVIHTQTLDLIRILLMLIAQEQLLKEKVLLKKKLVQLMQAIFLGLQL